MSSPHVSPETVFLDDVITMMQYGELSIPQFQRPYVWEKRDVIDLFDSLYKGYPIGSILVWDCNYEIPSSEFIGNNLIENKNRANTKYIIDGQQRLTSLFCALYGSSSSKNDVWDVYFDLVNEKFYHPKSGKLREYSISLKKLRSTGLFLKETRELYHKYSDDNIIEKAERLADSVRKYKVSIINLVGGELSDAIEIFTRLNRTGKDLNPMDIIFALNYDVSHKFSEFRNEIKLLKEKYSFIVNENDFEIKMLKVLSGFDFYGKETLKLASLCSSLMSDKDFINLILISLDETLNFVVNDLLFDSINSLPYSNSFFMVLIYIFNKNKNNSPVDYARLKKEFYLISFKDLPNTSPSGIGKLISFFGNDFDVSYLSDKLKKSYFKEFKNSDEGVNARSAHLKILFNMLINYCNDFNLNISHDEFCYPPKNIDKNINKLGNKNFFHGKHFRTYEGIIYTHLFESTKSELSLLEREKMYHELYRLGAKKYC